MVASFIPVIILIILLISCKDYSEHQYKYKIPEKINDGIEVGTLEEVDIDTTLIIKGISKIMSGAISEVHSILLYKEGKLVLEEYFPGHKYKWDASKHKGEWVSWDRNMLHSIMSDTKSITSTCIGIAIDLEFIKSANQSIFDFLPNHQHLKTNGKGKITIEHLLSMTSGLEWHEWGAPYSSAKNPIIGIWFSDKDPISFILEGALEHEPGTHFSYYGGNHIILGEIIKNATNLTIADFSYRYLFNPMGTDSTHWSVQFDNGVFEAAGGLKMKPRDMAKLGITFLNNGIWNKKRIISEKWIGKCMSPFPGNKSIKVPGEDYGRVGYSYSWWTKHYSVKNKETAVFWAGGWGGQKIIVAPDYNTVIVLTGGNYTSKVKQFGILEHYIFPAIR